MKSEILKKNRHLKVRYKWMVCVCQTERVECRRVTGPSANWKNQIMSHIIILLRNAGDKDVTTVRKLSFRPLFSWIQTKIREY